MSALWVRRDKTEPHPGDVQALADLLQAVNDGTEHGATWTDLARAAVADGWRREAAK